MRRFHAARFAVVAAVFALGGVPGLAQMTNVGPASARPEGFGESLCATNLQGLGICEALQFCEGAQECDASTPCPDGKVCTVGTACASTLLGKCFVPQSDGGCSNPGTSATGFEPCEPIVFHEDFAILKVGPEGTLPGLDKLEVSTICGSGGALFKETACDRNDFASSPLETAVWGTVQSGCTTYATATHRVVASTGPVDVSSCARSRLDFDYAIALQEAAAWDRVFVTVLPGSIFSPEGLLDPYEPILATNQAGTNPAYTTPALSCEGGALPVGKLKQDGNWHHFHAELGDASQVEVKFYVETYDHLVNSGQGFFFDDVRIDCTDLIFDEGFEGANLLPWSSTTAPPLLIAVTGGDPVQAGSCKNYLDCGGPGSGCLNFATAEGTPYCISNFFCGKQCASSGDCAVGEVCVVDSCCLGDGTSCTPAVCNPGTSIFGPEAQLAGG